MNRHRAPYPYQPVRRALGHGLLRLARVVVLIAVAAAFAPVTAAAAAAFCYAWWRGHPPRRIYAAAAWCLPMVAAWLTAVAAWPASLPRGTGAVTPGGRGTGPAAAAGPGAVTAGRPHVLAGYATYPAGAGPGGAWFRVAAAPYRAWAAMWHLLEHGHLAAAAVAAAPPAVPLGILAGGACWAYRRFRMRSGAGGLTPEAPAAFDQRQWRHQVRTARALIAAPGSLPLISRAGHVVAGATIRAVRPGGGQHGAGQHGTGHHGTGRAMSIPYERLRAHQVVIGSTGTGKTTLLLRLWAGFMAAGLRRYAAGTGRRPLLVVLDCKGGAASRKVADRTRRVLREAGARSTACWPDEASLSLWTLPPDQLVTTLLDLIEHGTGGAAYYSDVMEALVALAVYAPCGPPANSADFLARLDADWLAAVYGANGDGEAVTTVRSGRRAVEDVKLRFRALWRRLGAGLDGNPSHGNPNRGNPNHGDPNHGDPSHGNPSHGGSFTDFDAWYCVLEGTAEAAVAEAQARALTDLLAFHALGGDREILLCVDEFSAVSRRLPISRLYERARSLGLAVQVSAQSWEGLAGTEDERQRLAATAEGGIWLLRTPRPSPVAELAGTLPAVDTSRRFSGAGAWGDDGLSRTRPAPVLDGDLVRRLDVGQVCYIYRGGVTFLQVKRLTGQQAAIGRGAPVATPPLGTTSVVPAAGPAGGAASDAPTVPFPAVGAALGSGTAPRPAAGAPAGWGRAGWPGQGTAANQANANRPVPGPALPDADEVLDEAFGERRA